MGKINQFWLLLWKNVVLRKRAPVRTFFQITMPLFFIIILVLLRTFEIKNEYKENITYPAFDVKEMPPNIVSSKLTHIAYAPDNLDVQKIMNMTREQLSSPPRGYRVTTVPFRSEKDMVQALVNTEGNVNTNAKFLGGVAFSTNLDSTTIVYKIRLSSKSKAKQQSKTSKEAKQQGFGVDPNANWNTQFTFPVFEVPGPRNRNASHGGPPLYFEEGFLSIQHAVDSAIFKLKRNISDLNVTVSVKRFPYPHYIHDNFVLVIQTGLPLLLMLSLVFTALNIVRDVVYEKEKKLKVSKLLPNLCITLTFKRLICRSLCVL